jgi:hypothetical protein
MVSEALALAAATLLAQPELMSEAQAELRRRVPQPVERTVRGDWERLLAAPERFWNGTW